ncbi:hypothetical protein A2867_02105 [Candidatus Daviesbacteria bacterium RIFCSPHIGHO2_01_FULL_40_11]|uniref:Uncharacterized protein n=1 Tax=Candidatus Daviesbacteria bacterium RIFCSPHIGHO2_01_FULL_40_11 TaxID=1797762 RepID=A0A1F5JLZ2_9BACT|nr:MAG: hypothetical protein A2867_02105 [Candidatus Daviesbacteria bacterium RIFCSPHIGHO2_01_FULL_40_11]
MAGPAPKEIQGITTEVEFVPNHEEELIKKATESVQQVEPDFQKEHATPDAPKPIPNSAALKKVGAERVGAEPIIDIADITDNVTDFAGKVGGHVMTSATGGEGLLAHGETAPGYKSASKWRERLGKLFHRK